MMNRNLHAELPEPVTGYELDPRRGWFEVVIPEATTNLISNPSIETNTTGYTGVTCTLAQTLDRQRRGLYSLEVTPAAGSPQVYYTIALTAGNIYTFSFDILGIAGHIYSAYFASSGGTQLGMIKTFKGTGNWQRVSVTFTEATTANHRLVVSRANLSDTRKFYLDGFQLEAKAYATTYVDGDLNGFLYGQQAYGWNGVAHASTSFRVADTGSGGRPVNLKDYGLKIMAVVGLGAPVFNTINTPLSNGGSFYQQSIPQSRQFTIAAQIDAYNHDELQRIRKDLEALLLPTRTFQPQEMLLRYLNYNDETQCDVNDVRVYNIPCVYESGLEGTYASRYNERLGLVFRMSQPYILEDGEVGYQLSEPAEIAVSLGMKRTPAGAWSDLPVNNRINDWCIHPITGDLWMVGLFTTIGGTTAAVAYFNGSTWTGVGNTTGANTSIYSIDIAPDGTVYVGGEFFTIGGVANTAKIAYYDGTWHPFLDAAGKYGIGTTTFNIVYRVHYNVVDNTVYVGGIFARPINGTISATVPTDNDALKLVNNLARWDGVANGFQPVGGNGTIGAVRAMDIDANGNVYVGGDFPVTMNTILHKNRYSGFTNGATSLTYAHTCSVEGSNKILIVSVSCRAATTGNINTVTYNGLSLTRLATSINTGGGDKLKLEIWYLLNPPTGAAYNVVISASTSSVIVAVSDDYTGVSQTTPFGTPVATSSPTAGLTTGALSCATAHGDIIVEALAIRQGTVNWIPDTFYADPQVLRNLANSTSGTAASNIYMHFAETMVLFNGFHDGAWKAQDVNNRENIYMRCAMKPATKVSCNYIAKMNNNGLMEALGTGTNGSVVELKIDSFGNVYAGGSFTTAGGVDAKAIAKWNLSGWSGFGSGLSDSQVTAQVNDICFGPDGNVYVAGIFDTSGSRSLISPFAYWNGSSWRDIGVQNPIFSNAYTIAFDRDRNLYISYLRSGTAYSGAATILNNSGKTAYPVFKINGPGTFYRIENITTGESFDTSITLVAGEVLTLDFDRLRFYSSAKISIGDFSGSARLSLVPGQNNFIYYILPCWSETGDRDNQLTNYRIKGVSAANTDNWKLYVSIVWNVLAYDINFYKNAAKTAPDLVAHVASGAVGSGVGTVVQDNSSGLDGTVYHNDLHIDDTGIVVTFVDPATLGNGYVLWRPRYLSLSEVS